jgi:hypothetical protein
MISGSVNKFLLQGMMMMMMMASPAGNGCDSFVTCASREVTTIRCLIGCE